MKSFILKLFTLIIIIGLIGKSAVGAEEKASSWLGVFTTDNVPIKGCYVTKYYGVFLAELLFNFWRILTRRITT